uniref:Uncharacterized protein n=1 Tax=Romanomermis culicivorax TaxID=13658 RepID=A0A915L7T7_ROMCU
MLVCLVSIFRTDVPKRVASKALRWGNTLLGSSLGCWSILAQSSRNKSGWKRSYLLASDNSLVVVLLLRLHSGSDSFMGLPFKNILV